MYELTIEAVAERVDEVIEFLDEIMQRHKVPMKTQVQLDIAVEEIFVNIARYGYPDKIGDANIVVDLPEGDRCISVCFIDHAQPYDPLQKPDPDISTGLEERPIGGLGIFMVKKSMDDMTYAYKDGCNILTIRKKL